MLEAVRCHIDGGGGAAGGPGPVRRAGPRWGRDLARGGMADNGGMAGSDTAGSDEAAAGAAGKPRARDLNKLIRYTMWSVFRVRDPGALEEAGAASGGGRDGL